MESLVIYCIDIGSVAKGNFGWARGAATDNFEAITGSTEILELVETVAKDLSSGAPVACGFECPLFVPVPGDPNKLTSARDFEGNRPWSAGAGATSLVTGLTETVWCLKEIRRRLKMEPIAFVSWPPFAESQKGLFVWEAVVTSQSKSDTHVGDAEIAVRAFASSLPNIHEANVNVEPSVHSLVGAALLRAGWTTELSFLDTPCVVIKA